VWGRKRRAGTSKRRVVMYVRRTCGLCDEARATILAERGRSGSPFVFEEVIIDGDEGLERAHGLRVPVVEIDGVERFETFVDPSRLRRLVR
jgi:glutaredoxin